MTLEQRIEALEKKIAKLEAHIQDQQAMHEAFIRLPRLAQIEEESV